jgi:hypothetical protein
MSVDPSFFGVDDFAFPVIISSPQPDYPAVGNVRLGIVYANGTMTGTLVVPSPSDVRQGVHYGAGGTEFTGTLIVGGGGLPQPGPGQVTGYLICYDANGAVEPNVALYCRPVDVTGDSGSSFDFTERQVVSDQNGLAVFAGLFMGVKYRVRRGTHPHGSISDIPQGASSPYPLAAVIGLP